MQQFLVLLRVGFGGLSAPLTDEFHACRETAWLMASPGNAARLTESVAQIDAGEIVEKGLIKE